MKLLVGLGNPGNNYAANRHNFGFMALDNIAQQLGCEQWQSKFSSQFANINSSHHGSILLLKPQTYMNLSGQAVLQCMSFYKVPLAEVFVFYDDLDVALGKIKLKTGGGNGGHNGLKSIDQMLGNNYNRIRLGIGRPTIPEFAIHNFVLSDFNAEEAKVTSEALIFLSKHLNFILDKQFDKFLNKYACAGKI